MQMHAYTVYGIIGPVAGPKLRCKSLTDWQLHYSSWRYS